MVQRPDPRKSRRAEGDGVGIHQGFCEYLFGKSDGRPSKYSEIMKHVDDLLEERKGYKLYITGHSLGGALATLFGFYAAASPSLPLPVTIVSVASPRVGNINFLRSFVEMESQGKLRHLRVANNKDPVTLAPTVSSKRALALSAKACSPLGYLALVLTGNDEGAGGEEVYHHTGMRMKLFKVASGVSSRSCVLSYSGADIVSGKPAAAVTEESNRLKKNDSSTLPSVAYHYGTSYSERMAAVESELKGIALNDLYREKAGGVSSVV